MEFEEVRSGRALADPLTEFVEWCVTNPEKVIALGASLMLLGAVFRLLRECLR